MIWKTPLEKKKTYLGSFDENKVVGYYHYCMFWIRGTILAHDTVTEPHVIDPVYRVIYSGFVSQKLLQVVVNCLHMSHIRSIQNVYKECMNATEPSMWLSHCKWHLGGTFR